MNKILKSFIVIIAILFLLTSLCPISFAETDFAEQIDSEEGSMFEKIIAGMLGGIAQAIFDLCTSETMGIGFKDYDELIFNKGVDANSVAPFTNELWSKTMSWYKIFASVAGILILIAVIMLSYKMMMAGNSTAKKTEAKDNLMRLLLRWPCNSFSTTVCKIFAICKQFSCKFISSKCQFFFKWTTWRKYDDLYSYW